MNDYEEARLMGIKGARAMAQADFDGMFAPHFPSPPDSGGSTSREAAVKILPECDRQRDQVLAALHAAPDGLTREELCTITGLAGDSLRPRCWELVKAGLINATTFTRLTESGRRAYILKAV
jgi:hypothetical protein